MPPKPPQFRPPGWKPRKAWQRPDGWKDPRKRGRAGQRDRQQVLLEEPLCRECLKIGKRVRAVIVDHIVPLEWSRCDERWNKQSLCQSCSDEKSAVERLNGPPADMAQQLAKLKREWMSSTGEGGRVDL